MDVDVKCKCGQVTGTAHHLTPANGNHLVCLCCDCQAFAKFLGREDDLLDASGGTEIFQIAPAHLEIRQGKDQIRCMRLTQNGLLRWYADCCKTPVGNTMATPKMPFVGIEMSFFDLKKDDPKFDQVFGPVLEKCFAKYARGPKPQDAQDKASLRAILAMIKFLVKNFLSGKHKPSPFFNEAGQPIVEPIVVSK